MTSHHATGLFVHIVSFSRDSLHWDNIGIWSWCWSAAVHCGKHWMAISERQRPALCHVDIAASCCCYCCCDAVLHCRPYGGPVHAAGSTLTSCNVTDRRMLLEKQVRWHFVDRDDLAAAAAAVAASLWQHYIAVNDAQRHHQYSCSTDSC